MADVKPIPDDYPQVIPYLNVDDAAAAIKFYTDVFGGTERMRMDGPPGKIAHAEVEIGRGMIMLADEMPDAGNRSARAIGATPVTVMVYVDDVDSVFQKALAAGAKELRPLRGPVRPQLVRGVARRGRVGGRDDAPRFGGDGRSAVLEVARSEPMAGPGVGDLVAGVAQAAHGDTCHQQLAPDAVALQPHQ
jgi:PhnB protein